MEQRPLVRMAMLFWRWVKYCRTMEVGAPQVLASAISATRPTEASPRSNSHTAGLRQQTRSVRFLPITPTSILVYCKLTIEELGMINARAIYAPTGSVVVQIYLSIYCEYSRALTLLATSHHTSSIVCGYIVRKILVYFRSAKHHWRRATPDIVRAPLQIGDPFSHYIDVSLILPMLRKFLYYALCSSFDSFRCNHCFCCCGCGSLSPTIIKSITQS